MDADTDTDTGADRDTRADRDADADADADIEPGLDARCKTSDTRCQRMDKTYLMLDIRYPITRTPRRPAGPHQEVHPRCHESCQEHYPRVLLQSIEHF